MNMPEAMAASPQAGMEDPAALAYFSARQREQWRQQLNGKPSRQLTRSSLRTRPLLRPSRMRTPQSSDNTLSQPQLEIVRLFFPATSLPSFNRGEVRCG